MPHPLESPALALVVGALFLTLTGLAFLSRRSLATLLAVVAVALLTLSAVVLERVVVTPREEVQRALAGLLDAARRGDLAVVLDLTAPGADEPRADAQTLLPVFDVDSLRTVGDVAVTLAPTGDQATVDTEVFVDATHRETGLRGADFTEVRFGFVREGDRWLLTEYSASKEWRRGAEELRRAR